jgi:hypothetical protein
MVLPHRACGCAAGAAPIPVYGWDLIKSLKRSHAEWVRDKVAAGLSPSAYATLAGREPFAGMIGCRCDNFIQRIEIVPPDV